MSGKELSRKTEEQAKRPGDRRYLVGFRRNKEDSVAVGECTRDKL